MSDLKPCPACDGEAELDVDDDFVVCCAHKCRLAGPSNDPDGAKWNALPRCEDADSAETTADDLAHLRWWMREELGPVVNDDYLRRVEEVAAELRELRAVKRAWERLYRIVTGQAEPGDVDYHGPENTLCEDDVTGFDMKAIIAEERARGGLI